MLEDAARAKVARVLDALEATGADYKWVERENLHVTLRFYGERPETELPALKEALARVARRPPFTIELSCVGAFGGMKNPKTLYLGLTKGAPELAEMAKELGGEEKFKAHVTLGRQRSLRGLGVLTRLLASYEFEPIVFPADAIALVKSTLSPKGSRYEVVSQQRCQAPL